MIDPKELLDSVISLIARDISEIEKSMGKLDHDSALDLVRYSGALLDITERKDKEKKTERGRLSKMSMEELILEYERIKSQGASSAQQEPDKK